MAKRGRKKLSKVTALSPADKGHLSRILKKVRQIKQNKAKLAPPKLNKLAGLQAGANLSGLNAALNSAVANYNRILATENLSLPSTQLNLKRAADLVNMLTQQLAQFSGK